MAIDFVANVGQKITSNVDWTVVAHSFLLGSYLTLTHGRYELILVHVYKHEFGTGVVLGAGTVLCEIAPKEVTGYGSHLHLYNKRDNVYVPCRELILGIEPMDFKSLDHVKLATNTVDVRYREAPNTTAAVNGTAKNGSVMQVIGTKTTQGGYDWYPIAFATGPGQGVRLDGYMAANWWEITSDDLTTPEGGTYPSPVDCNLQVSEATAPLQNTIKENESRIASLEAVKAGLETQIETKTTELATCTVDLQNTQNGLQEALNKISELEQRIKELNKDYTIGDLFSMLVAKFLELLKGK